MGAKSSRKNEIRLHPHQRRQAIILILAAGLARLHGSEKPLEKPPESPQEPLARPPR